MLALFPVKFSRSLFFLLLIYLLFPNPTLAQPVRGTPGDLWADRILGQVNFGQINPNQPDGRHLFNPGGVLVDADHNQMFVYDSGNNRVLVYNNLTNALSSSDIHGLVTQGADAVLGQPDFNQSASNGDSSSWDYPNLRSATASTLSTLNPRSQSVLEAGSQSTMAVDSQGNFYVTDYYNNRVLRYSRGSGFTTGQAADHVWGQLDFTSLWYNQNLSGFHSSPTSSTLGLFDNSTPGQAMVEYAAGVAIDSWGNLWVADQGNNRVLRFPNLGGSAPDSTADVVLGQSSFNTSTMSPVLYQTIGGVSYGYIERSDYAHMWMPTSVRVDGYGNVFVTDILEDGRPTSSGYGNAYGNTFYTGRVLVFPPKGSGSHGPTYDSTGTADYAVTQYVNVPVGLELDAPVSAGGTGGLWVNDTGLVQAVLYVNQGGVTSGFNFTAQKVLLSDQFGAISGGGVTGDNPGFYFSYLGPQPSGSTNVNPWYFHDNFGGIGVNRMSGDVYINSMVAGDVWRFPTAQPTPQVGTAHAAANRFFNPDDPIQRNAVGNVGMFLCGGVVISSGVSKSQIIASDIFRLMYWDMPSGGPAGLTNGQPADGTAGTPYPYNQATGNQFSKIAVDRAGHLWASRQNGNNSWVEEYNLPLTNGQAANVTLGTPIPGGGTLLNLKGGGTINIATPTSFGNPLFGLAVDPNDLTGGYLWISDSYSNRVVRVQNPLTAPLVDVILGQSNATNNFCNDSGTLVGDHTGGACTQPPSRTGLFSPGALKFDHNGDLYVSDIAPEDVGNGRMLRWNKTTIDNSVASAGGTYAKQIPADMVYGAGGITNFTVIGCQTTGGICGPWEPAFNADDNRMVVGSVAQGWGGPFPVVLQNPLTSDSPLTQLSDYGPASYAANFDDQENLYVAELNRDRVLIYFQPFPTSVNTPIPTVTPAPTAVPTPPSGCANVGVTTSMTYNCSLPSWGWAQAVTFAASGTVTAIYSSECGSSSVSVMAGLYDSSGTAPTTLLSGSVGVPSATGWVTIGISPVTVTAKQYWIVFQCSAGNVFNFDNTVSGGCYYRQISNNYPSWPIVTEGPHCGSVTPLEVYVSLCPSGSLNTPTPTPTNTPTITPTHTPTVTPTITPSLTATKTPTPTETNSPTQTPTITITPTPTSTPTITPTPVGPDCLYPNPNPGGGGFVRLRLNQSVNVRIQIWTLASRKIAEWKFDSVPAGVNDLPFDAKDRWGTPLSNGLYYVVVDAGNKRLILKLLILK